MANIDLKTRKASFSLGRLPHGDNGQSEPVVKSSFVARREVVSRLRVLAATSGRTQGSLLEEAIADLLSKYDA